MSLLLGIDTGGTYTDAVLFDESRGVLARAKSLTTRHDLTQGVGAALDGVLARGDTVAGTIGMVSLSTTLATNALVEGHGSPVCLVMIGQTQAMLERAGLGRALAGDPVVFVGGGHLASGDECQPLDLDAVRAAAAVHGPQVSAFAVAGYFAVRNAAHEVAAAALLREACGLPVTASHELSSALDAPRRALTALLNARLIHLLHELVRAVRGLLAVRGIDAPLMVVKGDGSLISAEEALRRPVETILSGPAASVVGAHHLAGVPDALVSDMGGTTTDVALLRGGRPALDPQGASVGGWRTMVEAVSVHSYGLGGDSEVHMNGHGRLSIGPRRAVPLSLLAVERPDIVNSLHESLQVAVPPPPRFALRLRPLSFAPGMLSRFETMLWEQLGEGPAPLAGMAEDLVLARALERLVRRGLVAIAAFTPSDASHVLGRQSDWDVGAACIAAECWIAHWSRSGRHDPPADANEFAARVVECVTVQTGLALVRTALAEQEFPALDGGDGLALRLVTDALGAPPAQPEHTALLTLGLRLERPLVAIGAPAASYYPAVAARLGTRLVVPEHADVCNALGAVASGVLQSMRATITAPAEDVFRVHLPSGVRDFRDLEAAAGYAARESARLARELAAHAGATAVETHIDRRDRIARGVDGRDLFVESVVTATAAGRPRHAL